MDRNLETPNRKQCSLLKGLWRRGVYETIKEGQLNPSDIWNLLGKAISEKGVYTVTHRQSEYVGI